MRNLGKYLIFLFAALLLGSCGGNQNSAAKQTDWHKASWNDILQAARGQQVTLMMWQGDPDINKYMNDFMVPHVKKLYDVDLKIVSGQGNQIVNTLMTEMEAGKQSSQLDMAWINGETFYQLRQIKGLYGPFTSQLPNNQYIDWSDPFIKYDFQQPVNGYECPWGNVQEALIYNSARVKDPPQNLEELATWVKAHPGKFTIGNDFTGMTLLKSWMMALGGSRDILNGPYDQAKYDSLSAKLWNYVNSIKPYFWNQGETFPESVAQMHQLFASGELWFTISNNDGEVDNKVTQGLFPTTARAYVPAIGTIQNSHYMGIVAHAAHVPAAMVVCNFLLSPEAQYEKMKPAVWGDGTVLNVKELPADWQTKFNHIPGRKYAPPRDSIQTRALREPAPQYMINLYRDFRKFVIEKPART